MAVAGLMHPPFLLLLLGASTAWYCYKVNTRMTTALKERTSWLYRLLDNSYYLDKLNEFIFVRGARLAGRFLWTVGDKVLIDELVVNGSAKCARKIGRVLWGSDRIVIDELIINGSARLIAWFAAIIRQWQSGHVYHYALMMIVGVLALLLIFLPFPFIK